MSYISQRNECDVCEPSWMSLSGMDWTVLTTETSNALTFHKKHAWSFRFHPVLFNQWYDDGVILGCWFCSSRKTPHCLLKVLVFFHVLFYDPACLSGRAWVRIGDLTQKQEVVTVWGRGQLQHLLLHSSSHFNLSISASLSRRNMECVWASRICN